jgi:hypothetical protein
MVGREQIARGDHHNDELIAGWLDGDLAFADAQDREMRRDHPALHDRLLVERNRAWIPRISAMLEQPGTTFVLVGGAHLAGDIELVGETAQASISVDHFDIHDGAWSAQLTVPAQADPDDTFVLTATCNSLGAEDGHDLVFEHQPVDFAVTAPTTTTRPAPDTPTPAPALPAAPVVAEPTFTG